MCTELHVATYFLSMHCNKPGTHSSSGINFHREFLIDGLLALERSRLPRRSVWTPSGCHLAFSSPFTNVLNTCWLWLFCGETTSKLIVVVQTVFGELPTWCRHNRHRMSTVYTKTSNLMSKRKWCCVTSWLWGLGWGQPAKRGLTVAGEFLDWLQPQGHAGVWTQ